MSEDRQHWIPFGKVVRDRRKELDLSPTDMKRMTRISTGFLLWIETGKARASPPLMRLLAAILGIENIDVWIVAVHGLRQSMSFVDAARVSHTLNLQPQPLPDVSKRMALLKPLLECNRCWHVWRQKREEPPEKCPDCKCTQYSEPWTEQKEQIYQQRIKRRKQ